MSVIPPPAPETQPTIHEPVAPMTSPNIPGSPPGTTFGPAPTKADPDLAKDPANRDGARREHTEHAPSAGSPQRDKR